MRSKFWRNINVFNLLIPFLVASALAQSKTIVAKPTSINSVAVRSITIATEPNATVWLKELKRGVTNESGRLLIQKIGAGAQSLRIRAIGFAEKIQTLPATARGEIRVVLTKTDDAAELLFQQAETLRESGKEVDRSQAIELYRQALKSKPNYLSAIIGLARVLGESGETDDALAEIAAARKLRPAFAEASTVEGRIYRSNNDTDNAIKSFTRALREAKNIQPEAHTGLALAYQDQSDFEKAAAEFKIAVAQLADTEPIIYQLLGETYERINRKKEAITIYEKFLQLAPKSNQASAVRSILEQLKKQDSGDTPEILPQ